MRAGLPPNWQELASRVKANTGSELLLRPPEEAFSSGPQDVEVHVDGVRLGQFQFWWDEADPDEALDDLAYTLFPYLDEVLKTEDWGDLPER